MKQPNVDGLLKQETALDAYLHTDSVMMITSHYGISMDLKRTLLFKISLNSKFNNPIYIFKSRCKPHRCNKTKSGIKLIY